MINSSEKIQNLIFELTNLPGLGRKSASRIAYFIANAPMERIEGLTNAIKNVNQNVKHCKICYSLSDDEVCNICKNDKRNKKQIMVVENERDMISYENVGEYNGVYHILGGAISPLMGIGPNELKIKELIARLKDDVEEVIIATNSSIEGETTASYLVKIIKPLGIKMTRIASGVPVGGDIENIDEVTLLRALNGRVLL